MVEITCQNCNNEFTVSEIVASRGRKFCSQKCNQNSLLKANAKYEPYKVGDRVGNLTILELHELSRQSKWKVRCDCGKEKIARASHMRSGRITSCGCYRIRIRIKHGLAGSPEWSIHHGIIARTKAGSPDSHLYFDRGITVSDRWLNGDGIKSGFECFYEDMGPRPSPKHSVDRKDNDGNYETNNCHWATNAQQSRNRRQNIYININGVKTCLIDAVPILAPELGYACVLSRIYKGWPVEKALKEPKKPGKPLRLR